MRFLTEKIRTLGIAWNERPLDEAEFYRLCKRYEIVVEETPLSVGGFYYRLMGRDFIAINSGLRGAEKLSVMFHELGHYLFHTPESGPTVNFHGLGGRARKEREADVFALCAVIPKSWIKCRDEVELTVDEGISAEMIASRQEIFARYGL